MRQRWMARGAEQRLVDEGAGQRADLRAKRGAGERGAEDRQARGEERAADGGAGNGEGEGGHGGVGCGGWGVVSGEVISGGSAPPPSRGRKTKAAARGQYRATRLTYFLER